MESRAYVSSCRTRGAPAHKRDFMAGFLRERGVEVRNSEAFGLSYTGLAAYPDLPTLFI